MEISQNSWAYWYDLINEKERDDDKFYLDILSEDTKALEIACGTGRLYLQALQQGIPVDGVDISDEMLTRLKNKAEEQGLSPNKLYNTAVETMDLDQNYDIIYYPFNSIAHITGTTTEQKEAFSNIQSHLTKNGKFAFDIYVLDFEVVADENTVQSKTFTHKDTQYKFETWSKIDSLTEQTIISKNRIINLDTQSIEWETDHHLSLYPKQQLELLLEQAGFTEISFYHEFTKKPLQLQEESKIMSIIAR